MRQTKKFKTSDNKEIEIYTYITGGEARIITDIFLEGVSFELGEDGKPKTNQINAGLSSKAQDKLIEILIVSIDGKKENILDEVLGLKKEDFDLIISELDKIQNGIDDKKKLN